MNTTEEAVKNYESVNAALKALDRKASQYALMAAFVNQHREVFADVYSVSGWAWTWCNAELTIRCTREQMYSMLHLHRGKWQKATSTDGARYKATIDRIDVILHTDLPDTCRIEYEEEIVEAVPEHIKTVAKVICDDGKDTSTTE